MDFDPARHHGRPIRIHRLDRPLQLVTVSDRAMQPEMHPGQQVFVNAFRPSGVGYMEQRFALRYGGRTIIRRVQVLGGRTYRLFGNRDGYVIELDMPDGWAPAWETGRIHPECVAIGPLVYGYRYDRDEGGRVFTPVTHSWSN